MLNGDGLRVVLWVSGCEHHCKGCQNPLTWDANDGIEFTTRELKEICNELLKPHVAGITLSGGDPLHPANRHDVKLVEKWIRRWSPDKTIWIYTGYTWEDILKNEELLHVVCLADVLVDGKFNNKLADKQYHWAGSTNQRVINVRESLRKGKVVLHESN